MNIIVCVRPVIAPEDPIRISANGHLVEGDDIHWVTNPFDEYALEEAMCIKETFGAKITAISVDSQRALNVLRTSLAMGADEGLLILDDALESWNSMSRAKSLATFIRLMDFDLIFIGQRSIDGETGPIGPRLANYLNIPCLSQTTRVEIVSSKKIIRTHVRIEGQEMLLESPWPAVVGFERGIIEPRSFSMRDLKKAREKIISEERLCNKIPESAAIAGRNNFIKLLKLKRVSSQRKLQMIAGNTPEEKVANLFRILASKEKII